MLGESVPESITNISPEYSSTEQLPVRVIVVFPAFTLAISPNFLLSPVESSAGLVYNSEWKRVLPIVKFKP